MNYYFLKIKNFLLYSRVEADKRNLARKLQALALISATVMLFLNVIRIYDFIIDPNNSGLPLHVTLIIFLLFVSIWLLSKNGKIVSGAWLLINAYSLPTIFCFYTWGTDLPAAILLSVLIIMLAGLFLGSRTAIIIAVFYSLLMLILSYLQISLILPVSSDWRLKAPQFADTISYVLIFGIIFLLAWIIIRENHRALAALALSRNELQKERDQLEITVAKRTKEIIDIKKEKLEQLQSLASIGQLSGGIFHDIVNPLTVVNLNLEQIKAETETVPDINESQDKLQRALNATKRIKDLIDSTNNRLRRFHQPQSFSTRLEIEEIIKIMLTKAKAQIVNINLLSETDFNLYGDKSRFSQVIMNLIGNAIEACAKSYNKNKEILINLKSDTNKLNLIIEVSDNGIGIDNKHLAHIFQPFFSTKEDGGKNIGLGLSVVKEIIEQDFKGKIEVKSRQNHGSKFTLNIPLC
ncbi:GHKL domain-containing protein [Patescibacteria group bacterium]|nr:GHKL domain-containing protein [Patescibacteria group bacterium]